MVRSHSPESTPETRSSIAVRARLAPTPTGMLHPGNARTFLLAWLAARHANGRVVLRIEDIDRSRVRPHLEQHQIDDLRWLGLNWDEGPDVGGGFGPYRQSERKQLYDAALAELERTARAYSCICTRKDIQVAASAPQEGDEAGEPRYPGTCRGRFTDAAAARAFGGEPAWRLRVEPGRQVFTDLLGGEQSFDMAALSGDFVIRKKDGWPSYQLAVVVDDAAMGVTQVVRGDDLLSSTARQLLLYQALGLRAPREWAHAGLVLDETGQRMAKRTDALALVNMRAAGIPAERVVGVLAHSLGLCETAAPVKAGELVSAFDWRRIVHGPVKLTLEDFAG